MENFIGTPCTLRVMVAVPFDARGVNPPAMATAVSAVILATYGYWPG
jgi:hypothetical protein